MTQWHSLDKKEVLKILDSDEDGISDGQALKQLRKYGPNELKQISGLSPIKIFLMQLNSVLIYILFAAALFSLCVGHYIDFAVITIIILINALIGFVQQYKAEKTITELKNMLVPKARVFRHRVMTEILSKALVPGDIILLAEGDKVMADCRIINSSNLQANEAVLTGESLPSEKYFGIMPETTVLADRKNMLFMGTTVVSGNGKAVVVSTGMNTEFGEIAGLVQEIPSRKTPLEEKLDLFSKKLAVVVVFAAFITVVMGLVHGEEVYGMILTGIALAVSVIPEGIPAVIAITLAFAIQRMRRKSTLIRKLPAAETLGRTTVICTDKTGTITEGEMTVTELFCNNHKVIVKGKSFYLNSSRTISVHEKELIQLLRIGILCNNAREEHGVNISFLGNPTEKALILPASYAGIAKKKETEGEVRVKEFPFSSKRKMMVIVRRGADGLVSYAKGAPDILIKHCSRELVNGRIVELSSKRKTELMKVYEQMASDALRVLAFAYKRLPSSFTQYDAENNLVFAGFQGMMDPPRKEIKSAIGECISAGIKVKMLTGDSVITAQAIARQIGLDENSIEGKDLETLSKGEFCKVVREKTIFARITPELKLKIVQSLKYQKEIVAVTGDGVNDILALKESNIGVAMGVRGTDVTREVADIVLLDDNFSSIVSAVREGRRVYDNLKKSIKFQLSANVNEIFVVLFSIMMSMPLPLLPLAILWMNLITDSLPSISLSMEKEERGIMSRPPQSENILDGTWQFILLAGIISFAAGILIFSAFYQSDLDKARTITLTTLVFFELFLVFACRSEKSLGKIGAFSNKYLTYSVLSSFILQIIAIYTPLSHLFGFTPLSLAELSLSIAAASSGLVFFEGKKWLHKKLNK